MAENKIYISGEIGFESTAEDFKNELEKLSLKDDDTLRVIINSEGGSVFDGFDIYNQIKALPNKTVTEVRGLAASIASLIMLAGDTVEVSEASAIMVHRSMTMVSGNSEDIEEQTKILNKIDGIIIDIYSAKTGIDKSEVEDLLSEQTWFSSHEAVEIGLADNVINLATKAQIAAKINYNPKQKKMALKDLFARWRNEADAAEETTEETTAEETTEEAKENEPQNVSREEFDALVTAMEALAEAIDGLVVEGEEEETTEDDATEDEESAAMTEEQVDAIIEAKVQTVIGNLKKSKGRAPKGNNSLTGKPNGYVDKHADFRAKMAVIEKQTRN